MTTRSLLGAALVAGISSVLALGTPVPASTAATPTASTTSATGTTASATAHQAPGASKQEANRAAAAYLADHRSSFGTSAHDAFARVSTTRGTAGTSYVAYQRTYRGLPVVGGDVVLALDGSGKVLGLLPLGTLNLLARDIGMPTDLGEALAALAEAQVHEIDIGTLNGRPFHTISGMGFFSQMARARETARKWKLWRFLAVAIAALFAVPRTGRFDLEVTVDGEPHSFSAFAALISVNRFTGPGWRRAHLDEGVLELHIAEDRGGLALLKAGADLVADTWRSNPGIVSLTGKRITLRRPNRDRSWVSTDGELAREKMPLDYRIVPGALKLLIPPKAE